MKLPYFSFFSQTGIQYNCKVAFIKSVCHFCPLLTTREIRRLSSVKISQYKISRKCVLWESRCVTSADSWQSLFAPNNWPIPTPRLEVVQDRWYIMRYKQSPRIRRGHRSCYMTIALIQPQEEIEKKNLHGCLPRKAAIYLMRLATYLLTYSMVQSPSWEASCFAASQEIPHISRNPKIHYHTHKRPPPVSILGQPNPVHIPTTGPNSATHNIRVQNFWPRKGQTKSSGDEDRKLASEF